jgi:hypothetical protein
MEKVVESKIKKKARVYGSVYGAGYGTWEGYDDGDIHYISQRDVYEKTVKPKTLRGAEECGQCNQAVNRNKIVWCAACNLAFHPKCFSKHKCATIDEETNAEIKKEIAAMSGVSEAWDD